MSALVVLILTVALVLLNFDGVWSVPSDCSPLQNDVLDKFDPQTVFETTTELSQHQPPLRVSTWFRSQRSLPTQHFVTSQLKADPTPMVLWPYMSSMDSDGIVYDAFEFKRFIDPERTIYEDSQSMFEEGKPWHRLLELGTNVFQKITGPDGNPLGNFNGKTGVKVGITGSGEPELQDYGDLYANFMFAGDSGIMEVPLVRGSILLTHIFTNANPVITPYCLDNINGDSHQFDCPTTPASTDGASGYVSATCSGSNLVITLHNTRKIDDVSRIQWAANTAGGWSGSHVMHNCDVIHCSLTDDNKTVTISVPNAAGTMSYAINYIGHYLLPGDWTNNPEQVSCNARKRDHSISSSNTIGRESSKRDVDVDDITLHVTCDAGNHVVMKVDVTGHTLRFGLQTLQYAIEDERGWGNPPPMHTCDTSHCTRNGDVITVRYNAPSPRVKLAVNLISLTTMPYTYWVLQPFSLACGTGDVIDYGGVIPTTNPPITNPPTTHRPTTTQTTRPTTPVTTTHTYPSSTTSTTQKTTPTSSSRGTTAQTTSSKNTTPGHQQNNQNNGQVISPTTKFILELNEQGNSLPDQTRKYVLYFSEEVTPSVDDDKITFSPIAGGKYNGIMQLAYLGSGPRGHHDNDTAFDNFAGAFPFKPATSYCVSESTDKAHAVFQWNPISTQMAAAPAARLLMLTMPHHALLLKATSSWMLQTSVFGFSAYEGAEWDLEMELPRASMMPDHAAVATLTAQQKQEIEDAIARDAANHFLDAVCSNSDSYNVGKAIGLSARLASLSREFSTTHHLDIDPSIRNCLEKWLRIQDTLADKWKFHYDTTWGGLFLRATDGNLDFGTDYGFPYYNDHHFHLGYFIYALAYYVKHYPQWGQDNKHRIYLLARDVNNLAPSDEYFPVARHKDIYTGFSWATGIVPGTRQEESASEALNCYHGVAALGEAFNDTHLQHSGQVMLAMELLSVREYWQVRQHNRAQFPPAIQATGVCGQIAEDNFYVYALDWPCDPNRFPMGHACRVGIQVIPITAVSKYWVDQEWASSIENSCSSAVHPDKESQYAISDHTERDRSLNSGWAAFCLAAMSPLDSAHQQEAANYVKDKRPQELVGGTGAASTLLFIYAST